MGLRINDIAPDFTAESTEGTINFHDWAGDSYAIIFSHPRDFTPVCTTEFGAVAQLVPEFEKRGTKVIGVSVDSVADHAKWKRDIEAVAGVSLPMLVRSLCYAGQPLETVVSKAVTGGLEGVMYIVPGDAHGASAS